MRREGFELSISRPRVLMQTDPVSGKKLEPIEEVVIDVIPKSKLLWKTRFLLPA